ncbi:MAG: hypothetical protein ACREBE_01155 [bacterium]
MPSAQASSGTITPNAGGCFGRWSRLGNVVTAWFQFQAASVAAPTGGLRVIGLPAGLGIPANGVAAAFAWVPQAFNAAMTEAPTGRIDVNEDPPQFRCFGYTAGNLVLVANRVQAGSFFWAAATWNRGAGV